MTLSIMCPASMTTLKVTHNIYLLLSNFTFPVFDSDDSLIVKFCGTNKSIAPIFSRGNTMTVVFKTDDSRSLTGFKATWTSINIVGEIIKSPNYPLLYPDQVDQVKLKLIKQFEIKWLISSVCPQK